MLLTESQNIQESLMKNTMKLSFELHVPQHTGMPGMGYEFDWILQSTQICYPPITNNLFTSVCHTEHNCFLRAP